MNFLKIFLILFFIFTSNILFASTLRIEPIRLAIASQETITSLKIINDSHDAISVQIDPKLWTQRNNQDFYEATTDILVVPPIVSIAPPRRANYPYCKASQPRNHGRKTVSALRARTKHSHKCT